MRIFILEDDENRVVTFKNKLHDHDLVIVDNAEDAIRELQAGDFDAIFLDHDLGGETYVDTNNKNTGSEVVRWMCAAYMPTPVAANTAMIIHSLNYPASISMWDKLTDAGFTNVHTIPFTRLVSTYFDDPSFLK